MAVPWDVITAEATPFDREHVLQQRTHSTETRGRPVGRHHGGSDPIQPRMPAAHHSKLADSRTSPHLQDLQHLCVGACVYINVYYTYACARAHTHTYISHKRTHKRTRTRTHTHTHIHTRTPSRPPTSKVLLALARPRVRDAPSSTQIPCPPPPVCVLCVCSVV